MFLLLLNSPDFDVQKWRDILERGELTMLTDEVFPDVDVLVHHLLLLDAHLLLLSLFSREGVNIWWAGGVEGTSCSSRGLPFALRNGQ